MLRRSSWLTLAIAFALVVLSAPAAFAAENGAYVEGFLGKIFYETDFDLDETTFGARGGYRFGERWGIEGAISRQDVEFFDEVYFADFSLRRSLAGGDRTELFLIAGPGLFRIDSGDFLVDSSETELAFHAGLGLDINLGERFYLRPDVRARWIDSDFLDDDIHTEVTLGAGFRF